MTLQLGILLALLCAVAGNLGNFLKHRGCADACAVDIRHPLRTARSLWSQRAFAMGMGMGILAWLLHVAAIAFVPLSVVQVVLSGGVVLIAVMADRVFGLRVGPRQWWGLGLMAVGLALLALTMPTSHGTTGYSSAALLAFELGLFAVGGLLILGRHAGARAEHHGVLLAVAAGALLGVCNVAVKATSTLVGAEGLGGLVNPWTAMAAAASFLAFFASSRAYQDGGAVETIAVTGTAASVATIAGGIVVFGDPLPGTALGIVVQAVALVLVLVASALTPAPAARPAVATAAA